MSGKQISFYLTEDEMKTLSEVAVEKGRRPLDQVRHVVKRYLRKQKTKRTAKIVRVNWSDSEEPDAPSSDRGDTVRIYILFAYDWHYPSGGSGDCLKVFTATTVAEAIAVARAAIGDRHYDSIDLVRVTETELVPVELDD